MKRNTEKEGKHCILKGRAASHGMHRSTTGARVTAVQAARQRPTCLLPFSPFLETDELTGPNLLSR